MLGGRGGDKIGAQAQILIICRAAEPDEFDILSSKQARPSGRWAVRANGSEHISTCMPAGI